MKPTQSKSVEVIADAVEEVKKPEAYYLVPCRKLQESVSDLLTDILPLIENTIKESADCHNRHNPLVEQVK